MPLFNQRDTYLYVCWDMEERPERTAYPFKEFGEFTWREIPEFIPRQTDMIRSWGFYKAWEEECDVIVSLDDDVLPHRDIFTAYEQYFARPQPLDTYLHVGALDSVEMEMRGYPYRGRRREVAVQYGGWHGVPDLGAVEQLAFGTEEEEAFYPVVMPVPKGVAATCCAMNFAFKREYTPIMWQLALLKGRYNRMGDIWSGLIQKHLLDLEDKVMLINGKASVLHQRASDPFQNLMREAPGLQANEGLWDAIKDTTTPDNMWRMIWEYFWRFDPEYADHLMLAKDKWLALFS